MRVGAKVFSLMLIYEDNDEDYLPPQLQINY